MFLINTNQKKHTYRVVVLMDPWMVFRHLCSTTSRAICVVLLFFFYLELDMIFKGLDHVVLIFGFVFLCKLSEKWNPRKEQYEKRIFGVQTKYKARQSYFSKLKSQEFQKGREVVISYELNVYSTVKKSKVKGVLLLNEMVFNEV